VSSLQKYLIAVFLIAICTSTSDALANSVGLFSAQKMNQTDALLNNTSVGINNDFFAGQYTKLASASFAHEYKEISASPVSQYFEDITTISLHKDHDKITWSLAPSLNTYSLNPIDDIKNVQVLLQYKF